MTAADETYLDLALSRSRVDRWASVRTDDAELAAVLRRPATRVLELRGAKAPLERDPVRLRLRAPEPEDAQRSPWFLGRDEGADFVAVTVPPDPGAPDAGAPEDPSWAGLREVGADLDDADAGLLTAATALQGWHARHGYCPRCGTATEVMQGGWLRRCPRDGSEHHPRTDPAVIMAVTDDQDRLLLATGLPWPEGRVSVLAGFVEAGESLEAAVAREVGEEVGVEVTDLRYRGNQPWPFPASLMMAYRARALGTELRVQESELRSARWYSRDELAEGIRAGRLTLPSRVSIAHRLIQEWFGAALPGDGPAVPW
ncbi:NADH pyrophosphatase [Serinicoccus hydrothermalis]|uniref:NAD(+) diphosphatase n=1 Tax=Serinicoccus hydrothermalis TaxID=1758689 RepID=A0A1B1NG84_9MICO|nr:NAD(+) diphosphatase [Serinicoccus hydrothermalis]ANS80419.1 NADH pyrophosphatase [Serinicoccus hydrothermalis]